MRHRLLLQAALAVIVLGSAQLQAGEDYPAANFEPRVIFQDAELIQSVGPLPIESPGVVKEAATQTLGKDLSGHTKPAGAVTDSSPPYGMLLLALIVIGLPFWLSIKEQKSKPAEEAPAETPDVESTSGDSPEDEASEESEEDLETLAEEVEETMATSNRQRANKTKRARRR